MNIFCKLNRITFHFFNFTLSLSSKQLAILLLRCSPYIPFVNSITFSPSNSTSAPPCRPFQLCPHLFCTLCPPLLYHQSTLPKHATTTLPPQKQTLYNARVRERKKTITFPHHGLHCAKTIPLPHSPTRTNAIRASCSPLPCLAEQTNLRKQVGQQTCSKPTTPTNHPAPIDP